MAEAELPDDLDPVEFMRAVMRLSPKDAAQARKNARSAASERRRRRAADGAKDSAPKR